MTERERLRAALIALVAEDALILEAQAEVARYLSKEIEAAQLVSLHGAPKIGESCFV